jgi:hypothetical protein
MHLPASEQSQLRFASPEGAQVLSQGRKPLDHGARGVLRQPRRGGRRVPPLRGYTERAAAWFQGLTPLATNFRPAGARMHRLRPQTCQQLHNPVNRWAIITTSLRDTYGTPEQELLPLPALFFSVTCYVAVCQ